MLAAGRFETVLKRHLHSEKPQLKTTYAHLGALLEHLKKHQLLGKMHPHIELLKRQRNYLAHSIHALLTDWVGETILERENLLDSDLSTYTDRARDLTDNLNALSEIVERENAPRKATSRLPRHK